MKIAVLSTIYRTVPPSGYGGIERVISIFVEGLVQEGHEVYLFALPGSVCSGKLIKVQINRCTGQVPTTIKLASDLFSEEPLYDALDNFLKTEQVDIIHDWSLQNLFVRRHPTKIPFVISTCIPPGSGENRNNLVACSRAHAELIGGSTRFVHYGLDLDNWRFSNDKKNEFIHIAKIAGYKGQHLAILAARKAKASLLIAGNVENKTYYNLIIRPLIKFSPRVRYIGEINGTNQHLLSARALIQTPKWFDAFPLVVLEALASGTPVIAFATGGIPEQIVHGKTGFLCQNYDEIAEAMRNITALEPLTCRQFAEKNFSIKRMVADYIKIYADAIAGNNW